MKKFLLKILSIGLCILISLIIEDYALSKNYQKRNYYPFTTMTEIVEGRLNSDLWILGSSRAFLQYNPRILDSILDISSYNLGMNAQFLVPEILCYRNACEFNKKPKYILIDVLWKTLTMETPSIIRYFYMPYIYNPKIRDNITNNRVFSLAYLYVPYYRFHVEKNADKYFKNETNIFKGHSSHQTSWNGNDYDGLDTVSYKHETEAIKLLDNLLSELKNESITVILIHSPFYVDGLRKIQHHDEMMSIFRTIANNNNVPFLDYTNDHISYDTSNFYNNMHLNTNGANLFSLKLAHDLDSLELIPTRQ